MSSTALATPIIDAILHPSDFSEAGDVAFAHALKAALIALQYKHKAEEGRLAPD